MHILRSLIRLLPVLCIWALGASAHGAVLDPPSLRCASVLPNGDVQLTWVVPPDPNTIFQEYIVYFSSSQGGPYAVIGTIPVYGMNGFFHAGAGATMAARFYFMTTVSVDAPPNESVPSDTLSTMFLSVGQSTPLGSAVLDWTQLHSPPLGTSAAQLQIELEYPAGTWTPVASVDVMLHFFEQVIDICADSLTYRISLNDQLGCASYSNLDGDQFADVTAPTPPVMVTISVDTATNQAVLDWDPSPEADTYGYIIVFATQGGNQIIDTIYGQNNTSYVWALGNAGGGVESYTVAAFDTCFHGGPPPAPNTSATKPPHSTVYARTLYNKCLNTITVLWTPYVGWPVMLQELYVRVDNGPLTLLGTFGPDVFSYLDEGVDPFRTYCYVVRSMGAATGQIVLSNQVCQITSYPPVPAMNYISNVTVVAPDHIEVTDKVDPSASVYRYRIQRSFNGEPWDEIASVPDVNTPSFTYDDIDVETDVRSYSYRIIVDDSCRNEVLTSNIGASMLLIAEAQQNGVNHLRWNGYGDWAGSVSGFRIYRSIGGAPFSQIAVNAATAWELDDNVNNFITSNGRFCYRVEARETGNPSGVNAISVSNEACAVQPEAVWIPNAFIAGGVNDRFRPVVAFVDVDGYELIIYNRWGQEIWKTNDREEAWDGRINGYYVPQGVYAYYCGFYNGTGNKFEERGTVTFLCCPDY